MAFESNQRNGEGITMPNWVHNTMQVTGNKVWVETFIQQAKRPGLFSTDEGDSISELSFANFIRPSLSIMGQYWGEEPRPELMGSVSRTTSNHWYDWNIRNWGTKWDASRVDVVINRSGDEVRYEFDTAWGPPLDVFYQMVSQFHDLTFNLHYVEEQGWGGDMRGVGGKHWVMREWDIPGTHVQSMEYISYCKCEHLDDDELEWAYNDCPRKLVIDIA